MQKERTPDCKQSSDNNFLYRQQEADENRDCQQL